MRKVSAKRFSSIVSVNLCIGLLLVCAISGSAQTTRNTDYSPDKTLQSNARVNPSTLAMELSIPLGGYTGRAGNSMPVTFDYTSKVWQMRNFSAFAHPSGEIGTTVVPMYARRSAAGWTTSLGVPRIDYQYDLYTGNYSGAAYEGQIWTNEYSLPYPVNLYYIKRVRITLPNGSSHELRASDAPIDCGNTTNGCPFPDFPGTYLSVDGSKMRLEEGTTGSTLYMPDGSRYLFGAMSSQLDYICRIATAYIDRHGNRTTYNSTNKQWTDTMGRVLTNPLLANYGYEQEQTVGDQPVTLPGMNGGTTSATLSWRYLKDPNGGESGLGNPNQNLSYPAIYYCDGGYFSTVPGTYLFTNTDYEFRVCNYAASYPGSTFNPVVLTKITLANGQSYQFKYNLYGEIEKIIYPTGGYERFIYSYIPPVQRSLDTFEQTNRGVVNRWMSAKGDGTDEISWTYAASRSQSSPYPYKVTTTNPDGTRTEQLLHDEPDTQVQRPYGFDKAKTGRSYEDRVYSSGNPSQLLRRHLTSYEWTGAQTGGYSGATRDFRPKKEISIIFEPGSSYALAQMSETVYDTHTDAQYFASLNPKQTKTYHYVVLSASDAQPSTLTADSEFTRIANLLSNATVASIAEMDYLYDSNYKTRNITGLVTETRVKDASENVKAKIQISYDESSYSLSSSGTMPTAAANSWVDLTQPGELGSIVGSKRGLPTTVKNYSDIATSQYIETHSFYDQYGNLRKTRDGRNKERETEYDDDYAFAYPTKSISPIPGDGTNGSNAAFITTAAYNYNTGLPTSTTDANGLETRMEYVDALLRPTKASNYYLNQPVGGQTITEYGAGTTAATRFVKVKTQIDEQKWKEGYSWYDGLGRTYKTQSVDSSGDVFTETQYDNMGRAKKSSNPYRTGETVYWTENFYDDLGRVKEVHSPLETGQTTPAKLLTAYSLATTGSQIGTVVTVTDQALKQRRSITNALGQLKRVDEPNDQGQLDASGVPAQSTAYSYDPLNNLTTVTQGSQTRSFVYDSLSRLKSATNPEHGNTVGGSYVPGTISYTYDNNGNLQTKTDARDVKTTYAYDALNRVISRTYTLANGNPLPSELATPAVSYYYDNLTNAKGKLIKVSSSVSTTEYTEFDNLGRIKKSKQTTDGTIYPEMEYTYNLSGALVEQKYPSGRVVKNVLDADGDLALVQSKKNANYGYWTYANSFTYTAAGAVSSMQLGNGRWESTIFNNRLQPAQIALGTVQNGTDKLKLNFDYSTTQNNGNVLSQTITVPTVGQAPGFTATQNYTYDSLNRLKSATETIGAQTWKQTFLYDRYGNRQFDITNNNTTTIPTGCAQTVCNPTPNTTNNRLNGYLYDNSGNTTTDAEGKTFVYDAENKQTIVRNPANQIIGEYFYDGDGKRVKKKGLINGQWEETIFVYDAAGKLVAEYSNQISQTPQVSYLTSDHLGSPRINTDQNGAVIARHDYHPFGEEIYTSQRTQGVGYADDSVRKQFTGYERDEESELDYAQARYFNSGQGRFTSVDPLMASASVYNPQTFNRYSYVMNNPLNLTDPTGMTAGCPEGQTCKTDDEGNEYYINAKGIVVYTGIVASVVTVAAKETLKEVIIEPKWWEMAWYYTKKGVANTGKGILTVGRIGGAALSIILNPSNTGCGADGRSMGSDGNCVGESIFDKTISMSDEPEPSADNPTENPTEEQTPADTKKKKDKKKEKEKKKARDWTKLSDGEVDKMIDKGIHPHDLKPDSKYDLYKNGNGDIFVRRKKGRGEPDPTGLNINDF
jgi:RHS repeat-associated protein